MDALWEKHPRRLSEAGLRRSSDHSVVLTEDTDSFIIGDRVWVGGTKPGQIAYIGETQFAPGDWAGIVLDEPIGKNDGSVAGVRYFQCSEKRGVFSRLTRLTRAPLVAQYAHDASPVSDAGSVFERPPSGSARARRTLSPNGSVRSMVSSRMNASVSTTANGELRIGDRVIVSSSRGSKAGILRYVGVTDFAAGMWAGVELDDPLGKNDGSVEGKRYFECSPRFGLFAPISKVSRSPSNRKPGACAVHSNGRATPIRRSNSRDSLTSLGTSVASSRVAPRLGGQRVGGPRASSTPVSAKNALQELLREKQNHLERLMRERELERSDVAKISMQAERAETALTQMRKEAAQTTTENNKLKAELDQLHKMLEDERQKVEDLMFRNEEENINKEDYNKYKEAMEQEKAVREQRIRELEAEAALQLARADANAAALQVYEEQRNMETAALVEQHKEELTAAQTLSSELQKLLDEAYALLKEKESEKDSLGKSLSEELSRVKTEYEKALNEAKTKIAIGQTEFQTQLSVLTAKLQLAESKLETEKQNLERLSKENSQTVVDLNSKLAQLQAMLDDKTHELNKVVGANKEHEVSYNKEVTKLKMELSAKVYDIEQLQDAKSKQELIYKSLQEEISRVKEEYSNKVKEYENLLNEISQSNEKSKCEIIELQQSLTAKTKEYEKLLNESNTSEKLINDYKAIIHERDKEIIKLKDEFEQATASFNIKHSKIAEEHKKEVDDKNMEIERLLKELENNNQTLIQNKAEFETLNVQFINSVDELKQLKEENVLLKQTINELQQVNNHLKSKISSLELETGELNRLYSSAVEKCNDMEKAKEKVEREYLNLTGETTNSNEQFNQLSQYLKDTERELQDFKNKHREIINNYERTEQELKQKISKQEEAFTIERNQLQRSTEENLDKLKFTQNKILEYESINHDLFDKIKDIESNNDKLLDENSGLKSEIDALKTREEVLRTEHESIYKKLEMDIENYKKEIAVLKESGVTSEIKLMEKLDQLTEAQNDLNYKLEEARKHEDSLQKIVDDMTAQLNNEKAQFEKEIYQIQTQLSAACEETNKHSQEKSDLIKTLQEKENKIKELTLKLDMLEVDLKSNIDIVNEKDRQIEEFTVELKKNTESRKNLEDKLNTASLELSSLKQKYETLMVNTSVEESAVKEQLSYLETARKEMSILSQDKTVLENKCKDISMELDKLKTDNDEASKKLNQYKEINDTLSRDLDQKTKTIEALQNKTDTQLSKIDIYETDISKLKNELSEKNIEIEQKEKILKELNNTLQLGSNESQKLIKKLQTEIAQQNECYRKEVENLKSTLNSLQSQLAEHEKQAEELQQAREKMGDLQNLLLKSENDIKQLTNINDGQKSNYEDLNKQLQSQYDEYKKESKRINHDIKAKLEDVLRELNETKDKNLVEVEKQKQLQQKLNEAERKIVELSNKLEVANIENSTDIEKNERIEKITIELQNLRKTSAESLSHGETVINSLKTNINDKTNELKQKIEFISSLEEEIKNLKDKLELVGREKLLLEKEMAEKVRNIRDSNDNTAMGTLGQGDNPSQKAIEEREMVEGQVSFLNSVIVDMQRKNEQLLARVQALEGGYTPSDSPISPSNGPSSRVAPRLFCDICDVFDAHDTEECPRQAAADEPPPRQNRKPPPPPRPYCDICEVFGHTTENCDEEETF